MKLSPEILSALVFVLLALGTGMFILGAVWFITRFVLKTNKKKRGKDETYECGVPLLGSARERVGIRFYLIALLFTLFDIETVFILPYVTSYRTLGTEGLWAVLVFVGVLGLGLLYLYRRGALEWE
jgi:NADH-quinone oxidoreductase subunit A